MGVVTWSVKLATPEIEWVVRGVRTRPDSPAFEGVGGLLLDSLGESLVSPIAFPLPARVSCCIFFFLRLDFFITKPKTLSFIQTNIFDVIYIVYFF